MIQFYRFVPAMIVDGYHELDERVTILRRRTLSTTDGGL